MVLMRVLRLSTCVAAMMLNHFGCRFEFSSVKSRLLLFLTRASLLGFPAASITSSSSLTGAVQVSGVQDTNLE